MNDNIVASLRAIVGDENVLLDPDRLEPYSHDETVGLRAQPAVVVRVTGADQVAAIMRLAQRERVPVTPRGAGYGLSGGAVPVCGGIVLSTEKMNRILEIDRQNLMVTVEPGVITGDIHRAVEGAERQKGLDRHRRRGGAGGRRQPGGAEGAVIRWRRLSLAGHRRLVYHWVAATRCAGI